MKIALFVLGMVFTIQACALVPADQIHPSVETGAKVFVDRCALCHGTQGMGEGILAVKMKDYPSTNLLENPKTKSRTDIYRAVVYGGSIEEYSEYMPPMGDDLTWTELESVVEFITLLREDFDKANSFVTAAQKVAEPSRKQGKHLFESRCVLCHGELGQGDGRMAKVIKSPPPANLTFSRLPDDYLVKIIAEGGIGVGRSPQMPPWGGQFSENEIKSIILYLKILRSE